LSHTDPDRKTQRSAVAKWLLTPFGARAVGVIAVIAVLAIIAGLAVVSQVTDQMRRDAETRLERHTSDVGTVLEADAIVSSRTVATSDV